MTPTKYHQPDVMFYRRNLEVRRTATGVISHPDHTEADAWWREYFGLQALHGAILNLPSRRMAHSCSFFTLL
jgi:hypothetical protein